MTRLNRNREARRVIQKFRKVLKNTDEATRYEIVDVLEETGPRLRNLIKLRTPVRTGALSRGIKYKVLQRALNLSVGVLEAPKAQGKLFYGYILNHGRKGGARKASRRSKNGVVSNYTINVKPLKGNRFVTGAGRFIRPEIEPRLARIWDRILKRADRS